MIAWDSHFMVENDYPMANKGTFVVAQVDRSTAGGFQEHWVILLNRDGSDYRMQDPLPYPVHGTETSRSLWVRRKH